MKTYKNDPYWTTAKFDSLDAKGNPVKRGTRIFYYPKGRKVYQGADAEQASRDFQAAAQDEAFYCGDTY